MDKDLLNEIIEELEMVSKIINKRLSQLYTLAGKSDNNTNGNQIKNAIEKQRQEIISQVEEMRKRAMSQATANIRNANVGGVGFNIPRLPTIPANDVEGSKEKVLEQVKKEKEKMEEIFADIKTGETD